MTETRVKVTMNHNCFTISAQENGKIVSRFVIDINPPPFDDNVMRIGLADYSQDKELTIKLDHEHAELLHYWMIFRQDKRNLPWKPEPKRNWFENMISGFAETLTRINR